LGILGNLGARAAEQELGVAAEPSAPDDDEIGVFVFSGPEQYPNRAAVAQEPAAWDAGPVEGRAPSGFEAVLDLLALGLSGRRFGAPEMLKEPKSMNGDYFCSGDCGYPSSPFDRHQTIHGAIDADDDALKSHSRSPRS
jgi:hypothetical protein